MKKLWLVASLLVVCILSGCFFDVSDWLDMSLEIDSNQISSEDIYENIYEDDCEQISDLVELRDFVLEQVENDNLSFSFIYNGEEELEPSLIVEISGAAFVEYSKLLRRYDITLTEYPGDRIVDAYFSGDTSNLSEDEMEVLEIAVDIVTQAREETETDWELELALHDAIIDRVEYSNADILYDKPEEQPRHLSVIGALLDGEANCQGYTDAFFTLASIAGFQVKRLGVDTPAAAHVVNLVCLGDLWYVVDATYDDLDEKICGYHLFNAGLDAIGQQYDWPEYLNIYSVVSESDSQYYFIHEDLVFDDVDVFSKYIAKAWARNGETVICGMLVDDVDAEAFQSSLREALESWGKSCQYRIAYTDNGTDAYYTVIFE